MKSAPNTARFLLVTVSRITYSDTCILKLFRRQSAVQSRTDNVFVATYHSELYIMQSYNARKSYDKHRYSYVYRYGCIYACGYKRHSYKLRRLEYEDGERYGFARKRIRSFHIVNGTDTELSSTCET